MFVKAIGYLCVLPAAVIAINLSKTRSYLPSRRYLLDANVTESDLYDSYRRAEVEPSFHTTGFVRLDTYDWVRKVWIQAQVLPIGTCFLEGYSGGSAVLTKLVIANDTVFRMAEVFLSSDCSGESAKYTFVQPAVETDHQLEQYISHVSSYKEATAIYPEGTGGMIIRSYYSAEGCAGNVAQYDLVSERCSVYGYPIGATGTFTCDAEAQTLVVTLYGPFSDDSFTYPICSPQDQDDAQLAADMFYSYYAYGTQVFKQPFACYEESSADGEVSDTPYFQQIECVPATTSAVGVAARVQQRAQLQETEPEPQDDYYAELSYYESLDVEAGNMGKE